MASLIQDRRYTREERIVVLEKFCPKMKDSAYTREVRTEILKSGITRLLLQDLVG